MVFRSPLNVLILSSFLLLGLAACSPAINIYSAEPNAQSVGFDGELLFADSVVQVGFEFWSPGGAAWITIYTDQPSLLLDASASTISVGNRQFQLDANNLVAPDGLPYRDRFADWKRSSSEGRALLNLPPGAWQGFELPAMTLGRKQKATGLEGRERMHQLSVELAFVKASGQQHRFACVFRSRKVDQIQEKDFEAYSRRLQSDGYYYQGRDAEADSYWLELVMGILLSIAFGA